eukprot:1137535-Pyramimonas_sp.AAC.1
MEDEDDPDAMVADDSSSDWETSDDEVDEDVNGKDIAEFDPNSSTLPGWLKKELTGEMDMDEEEPAGPIKSKNEVVDLPALEALPEIAESVELMAAGRVTAKLAAGPRDSNIIVQATDGAKVLDEGSIICLPTRAPIGRVEEIFGPVSAPFYIVR